MNITRGEDLEMCIHQIFRPKIHYPKEGVGDCVQCQPGADNSQCKDYYKIPVHTVYITLEAK
jgi:hypothetical protein